MVFKMFRLTQIILNSQSETNLENNYQLFVKGKALK